MRWLLLLGAEARYGHVLASALDRLGTLGPLARLTPARDTPAAGGGSGTYRNLLACLDHPGPRGALLGELKAIERALGRGVLDGVPLDIDLLGCQAAHGWQADAHARAKGEFEAAHVRRLLDEAGLGRVFDTA